MSLELSQEDSQEPLPPAPDREDDVAAQEWLEQLKARGTWNLGVVLGPTGSDKTRTLSTLKHLDLIVGVLRQTDVAETWPQDKAIISAIAQAHGGNPQRAIDRLSSVGLNTLPTWLRPFRALSNGQRARASCARNLRSFRAIDNFAATVDESNANCMAGGLAKIVRREKLKNVVVATTRRGVPAWSQADWCLVLGDEEDRLIFNPGTPLERPRVTVTMVATETDEAYARTLLAPVATAATRREPILAPCGPPQMLSSPVEADAATDAASAAFEVEFGGSSNYQLAPLKAPDFPWSIGLVYGPSGTGKSLIIGDLTGSARVDGDVRIDLGNAANPDALEALGGDELLDAVSRGGHLSSGERELLSLARLCSVAERVDASTTLPFDEFSSHLDRVAAARAAGALRRLWPEHGPRLVLATVHADVVEALRPCWAFDMATRKLTRYEWGDGVAPAPPAPTGTDDLFARPSIDLTLRPTNRKGSEGGSTAHRNRLWAGTFQEHHYMDSSLAHSATCFCARWGARAVGFSAVLPQPGDKGRHETRTMWRESRLVVIPDCQGLGLGPAISDTVARHFVMVLGVRFSSRTAHPRFGSYREKSPHWKARSTNGKAVTGVHSAAQRKALCEKWNTDNQAEAQRKERESGRARVSYSHEYLGDATCRAAVLAALQERQGEGRGMDRFVTRGGGDAASRKRARSPPSAERSPPTPAPGTRAVAVAAVAPPPMPPPVAPRPPAPGPSRPVAPIFAQTGLRGNEAARAWFDGASDSEEDVEDDSAPPPTAPVVIDVDADDDEPPPRTMPPTSFDRPIVIDDDAVPAATPTPPKEVPWWAEPLPAPVFDSPAERRAARAFTTRTRGTSTQRVRRAPAPAPRPFQRTTRVPRTVVAPVAAPADPFAVGATVELHGLVSNPAANGRRVVVVQTPPDVAARGRISVNLDGAVRAVKRENVRAVPGGVGAAPSTAAMAWLTPGFLSCVSMGNGRTSRAASIHVDWSYESYGSIVLRPPALASCETLALDQSWDKGRGATLRNAKR